VTRLEEVVSELDELLEEEADARVVSEAPIVAPEADVQPEALAETEDAPERCQALTKDGRQCKNRPISGSIYCHVHQGYQG